VARGRYAPGDYRNFIGFKVSKPVLERAFKAIYALEMKDVFPDLDLAIGSYRRTASVIIPKLSVCFLTASRRRSMSIAPYSARRSRDALIWRT
jgi:hypothetical protein